MLNEEQARESEKAEVEFKNLIFANDPERYHKLFVEAPEVNEDEIDFRQFNTMSDMREALDELREAGFDLDFEFDPIDEGWKPFGDEDEDSAPAPGVVDAFDALATQDDETLP